MKRIYIVSCPDCRENYGVTERTYRRMMRNPFGPFWCWKCREGFKRKMKDFLLNGRKETNE